MLAQLLEELVVGLELIAPCRTIDAGQLGVLRGRDLLEALPVEVLETRHRAKGCVRALALALNALDDPLQHPHVLAKSRPDELALCVAAEPVDAEDPGRLADRAAHLQ